MDERCFFCLRQGHTTRDCQSTQTCVVAGCGARHHISIHTEPETSQQGPARAQVGITELMEGDTSEEYQHAYTFWLREWMERAAKAAGPRRGAHVSLAFIPVILRNPANGKEVPGMALLDLAADGSLMLAQTPDLLGCQECRMNYRLSGIGDNVQTLEGVLVTKVEVLSLDRICRRPIELKALPDLGGNLRPTDWNSHLKNWTHLEGLASLPAFTRSHHRHGSSGPLPLLADHCRWTK